MGACIAAHSELMATKVAGWVREIIESVVGMTGK